MWGVKQLDWLEFRNWTLICRSGTPYPVDFNGRHTS